MIIVSRWNSSRDKIPEQCIPPNHYPYIDDDGQGFVVRPKSWPKKCDLVHIRPGSLLCYNTVTHELVVLESKN